MDIHARAEQLARESRGRLTKADAYRELQRRATARRRAKFGAMPVPDPDEASRAVERPYRLPYVDN